MIEPRNYGSRGSRRHRNGGRQHQSAVAAERKGPAGVEEQGTFIAGPPGTWEVLSSPPMNLVEDPVNDPWLAAVASCGCGNEDQGAVAVPPNEDASRLAKRYRWHTESSLGVAGLFTVSFIESTLA